MLADAQRESSLTFHGMENADESFHGMDGSDPEFPFIPDEREDRLISEVVHSLTMCNQIGKTAALVQTGLRWWFIAFDSVGSKSQYRTLAKLLQAEIGRAGTIC